MNVVFSAAKVPAHFHYCIECGLDKDPQEFAEFDPNDTGVGRCSACYASLAAEGLAQAEVLAYGEVEPEGTDLGACPVCLKPMLECICPEDKPVVVEPVRSVVTRSYGERSIRCPGCKGRHGTVAQVKLCQSK